MNDANLSRISVITCIYTETRWDDLRALIASLKHQTLPPWEIIVVVDHHPVLLERVRAHFPEVVVCANEGPRGASGARNTGVVRARGAVVAFIDDDAAAAPDWLAGLAACFDEKVLGVGGAIQPRWLYTRPRWFPTEFNWVIGCTYRGMPRTVTPVRNLIAANMSIRREEFLALGGFKEGFGKVGTRPRPEETELCIRAQRLRQDALWLYTPRARVYHHVPAGRARLTFFLSRCFSEGLGKANLVAFHGTGDGLQSERAYVRSTLPQGILRGLMTFARRGDGAGLARAMAIVAGLTATTAGYLTGRVTGAIAPGHGVE